MTKAIRKYGMMAVVDSHVVELREKFQDFSTKISHHISDKSSNIGELHKLLDDLINFTRRAPTHAVIYPDYDIILTSLGSVVSKPDVLVKSCQFICYLVGLHNVKLRKEHIEKIFNQCLRGLHVINSSADVIHVFKAMETLLQADLNDSLEKFNILTNLALPKNGILIQILSDKETNGHMLLAAAGCLETLLSPPSLSGFSDASLDKQSKVDEICETCMQTFISILERGKPEDLDDLGYCKLIVAIMRGMHHILAPATRASEAYPKVLTRSGRLGEVVGIITAFLGLGLHKSESCVKYPVGPLKANMSSHIMPVVPQELEEGKDGYKGRTTKALKKNRKKTTKKNVDVLVDSVEKEKADLSQRNIHPAFNSEGLDSIDPKLPSWQMTSDSDMSSSDVESGKVKDSEGRSAFSKVRQMACSLLLCVIKTRDYALTLKEYHNETFDRVLCIRIEVISNKDEIEAKISNMTATGAQVPQLLGVRVPLFMGNAFMRKAVVIYVLSTQPLLEVLIESATYKITQPSVLFAFWPTLLPDGMPTGPGHLLPIPLKVGDQVTLATLMLHDPASKGRALAAMVLAALITSWQRFLSQAECSREKRTMSFTPFSVALGWTMCSLHRHIYLAFSSESSSHTLLQLLRCCTALVLASSYHKLTPGLLHRLVAAVRPLLRHKDKSASVPVAAYSLFDAIVSLDPTPPEVIQIFTRSSSSKLLSETSGSAVVEKMEANEKCLGFKDIANEEDTWDNEYYEEEEEPLGTVDGCSSSSNQSPSVPSSSGETHSPKEDVSLPWIIEACLIPLSLRDRSAPVTVQTECLQVLSSIARNQDLAPKLLLNSHYWPLLQTRLIIGPGNVHESVDGSSLKYHWGKFWESLGLAIRRCIDMKGELVLTLSQAVAFWHAFLSGDTLVPLIQDMENISLRVVGCDVLATIGETIFGGMMRDKQILCETLLFGSSRDEEPNVKSAALRALGIYSLYPSLREDLHFLLDTADTLQSALEGDISRGEVWVKASWALGNLTDAFILNKEEGLSEDVPDGPLLELLETCAIACQKLPKGGNNADRVRCNAVRAAGNILRLIDFRGWDEMAGNMSLFSLGKRGKDAVEKIALTLVDAAIRSCDMKVRWNACYAISGLLKNNSLYDNGSAYDDLVTKMNIFPTLCSLVRDFKNLKVRISAAYALSAPQLHSNYGQRQFIEAWKALLEGLDNSQRSCLDIAGYNHQSNLIDQIVLTLCHLAKLVEKGDLLLLSEIIDPYLENTQSQMISRSHSLVPEKASLIGEAALYLATFHKNNTASLSRTEDECLCKLIKIFSPDDSKKFIALYPF